MVARALGPTKLSRPTAETKQMKKQSKWTNLSFSFIWVFVVFGVLVAFAWANGGQGAGVHQAQSTQGRNNKNNEQPIKMNENWFFISFCCFCCFCPQLIVARALGPARHSRPKAETTKPIGQRAPILPLAEIGPISPTRWIYICRRAHGCPLI